MKLGCPHCQQEVALDDSRLPFGVFKVKCPRCGKLLTVNRPDTVAEADPESGIESGMADVSPAVAKFVKTEIARLKSEILQRIGAPSEVAFSRTGGPLSEMQEGSAGQRKALVCTDDPAASTAISNVLRSEGYDVDFALTTAESLKKLETNYQLISVDYSFSDDKEGGRKIIGRINGWKAIQRRQTFLLMVAANVKTGDPNAAFFHAVNLTVNKTELGNLLTLLQDGMRYYRQMYNIFDRLTAEKDEKIVS